MRTTKRLGWLGLVAVVAGTFVAPASAQFAGSADVVEVEVPVQVVRDGQPVRGLTAADFEIYDGRKKVPVSGFHVVDLAAAPASRAAAVPLAGRRNFLLFFDLAFSDPKSVVKARDAARDLVIKGMRPGDLVGIATYSASRGPQIVLGFTSDRRQVDSALENLGLVKADASDPLKLVMARPGAGDQRQLAGPSAEMDQAQNNALLTGLGEQQANLGRESNRSAQKAVITAFTRAAAEVARVLAAVPGRKQVILFSEGFDSTVLTGAAPRSTADATGDPELGGQAPAADVGTSEPRLSNSDESFGSTAAVNALEKMLEELRRADCVIQAVDLGGLRAGGEQRVSRAAGKESLFAMARGTGGELFEGSNDLSAAMGNVLERTGVTYVLTFQPEKGKPDGSYHKLRVELKDAPRGTRVAYRPGYYAPRPYAELNPMEKLFEASSRLMGGQASGSLPGGLMAAPFRGKGERAYVPVLIEVDGPALLAGAPQGTLPVEVYAYALDADGAIQDFLFQSIGLDLAKAGPMLQQGGLKFFGHLDLPAGEHSIRTLVRNGVSGAYSLRVVPLTVPAAGGPALLPPLFPEAANRWLIVREAPRGPQADYPFMSKGQPFVPAAKPALAAGQEVPLALVGYGLGTGELKAEGKVLASDGKEVGDAEVRVLDREMASAGGPDRLRASFKPPRLAPGEYVLRVTVTGPAGAASAVSAPFALAAGR